MLKKYAFFALLWIYSGFIFAAAPRADLWPFWMAHDNKNQSTISHQAWQSILDKYLVTKTPDGVNRFNYQGVSATDKKQLNQYIQHLEKVKISDYAQQEQLAYWINLYNALTIKVVLEHYPVKSIMDITFSPSFAFWVKGPWDAKLLSIEYQSLSLNDIEHRILRPIWANPNIHYALNCASIGCPNLREKAYTAKNSDKLLHENAVTFLNSPRGLSLDNQRLTVSSIFNWFMDDFVDAEGQLINYFSEYTNPQTTKALSEYRGSIYYDYNWQLNEAKSAS